MVLFANDMRAVFWVAVIPAGLAVLFVLLGVEDRAGGPQAENARALLLWGLATLIAADLSLAFAPGLPGALLGIALWGAHMALTQGLLAKLVAERAPDALHGSAFGFFNLATGLSLLVASVVAGLLWDHLGSAATFLAGAGFATATGIMLLGWYRSSGR